MQIMEFEDAHDLWGKCLLVTTSTITKSCQFHYSLRLKREGVLLMNTSILKKSIAGILVFVMILALFP